MLGIYRLRDKPLQINAEEIADWRWVSPEVLQAEMATAGDSHFTPWFKLEWEGSGTTTAPRCSRCGQDEAILILANLNLSSPRQGAVT